MDGLFIIGSNQLVSADCRVRNRYGESIFIRTHLPFFIALKSFK